MRYENRVVIMFKYDFKLKRKVSAAAFPFHRVLEIGYVVAIAIPADTTGSTGLFL